jgi:FlaA1/EpsC-like NDP-sugar epimerase
MKRYILGAGAQGRITAELWRALIPGVALGFLDDNAALHGTVIEGIRVEGPIRLLMDEPSTQVEAVIAVGNNLNRLALAEACASSGVGSAEPIAILISDRAKCGSALAKNFRLPPTVPPPWVRTIRPFLSRKARSRLTVISDTE